MYINNSTNITTYSNPQSIYNKDSTQSTSETSTSGGVSSFDFTHISRGDLLQTVNNLINNGEMDLDESSSLVPFMGPKISFDGNSYPDSANEVINVFEMLKQSIAFNQSIGNSSGVLYDTKAYDALSKLQGSTKGVDLLV